MTPFTPDLEDVEHLLYEAIYAFSNKKYECALLAYTELLEFKENCYWDKADVLEQRAEVYIEIGDYLKAGYDYEMALKINPTLIYLLVKMEQCFKLANIHRKLSVKKFPIGEDLYYDTKTFIIYNIVTKEIFGILDKKNKKFYRKPVQEDEDLDTITFKPFKFT